MKKEKENYKGIAAERFPTGCKYTVAQTLLDTLLSSTVDTFTFFKQNYIYAVGFADSAGDVK